MADSNRIEVQLSLIAKDDLNTLVKAFNSFHGDTQAILAASGRGSTSSTTPGAAANPQTVIAAQRVARGVPASGGTGGGTLTGAGWKPLGGSNSTPLGNATSNQDTPGVSSRNPWGMLKGIGNQLPGGTPVQKLGWALAFGPQTMSTIGGLSGNIGQAMFGGGLTTSGAQLGLSTTNGIGGTGFGSSAFKAGFMNNFVAPIQNFTSPYWGSANQMLQGFGWNPTGGGPSGRMGQQLNSLVGGTGGMLAQGMSTEDAGTLVESMRYGGSNIGILSQTLQQLGTTAQAAHMSVATLTQQLIASAQAISEVTGQPLGFTVGQVGALTKATGFTPSALQPVLTNPTLQALSLGMAGGNIVKAVSGRNSSLYTLQALQKLSAPTILGKANGTFADIAAALKQGGSAAYRIHKNIDLIWRGGGWDTVGGGLTPTEYLNLIQRTGGMTGITAGFHAAQDIATDMSGKGGGETMSNARVVAGLLMQAGDTRAMDVLKNAHGDAAVAMRGLQKLQASAQQSKTSNAAKSKVSVELTGYAAKVFKLAQQEYDQAHSNQATQTPSTAMALGAQAYRPGGG